MELMTKGEYAYQRLRDSILSGELPAGSRLIVKDLVEEYGVSSMPIRNAIARLEEMGFVTSSAHMGAWVTEPNLCDYFVFMLLRIEAEALAARFAATNRTEEDLAALEQLLETMRVTKDAGDYEAYGKANRKTHNIVCAASGNAALNDHIQMLMHRTQISINFFSMVPQASNQSYEEHVAWLEALRKKDVEKSVAIIRYQRCRSNLAMLHMLRDNPSEKIENGFLQHIMLLMNEESKNKLDDYIKIFREIIQENDFRRLP